MNKYIPILNWLPNYNKSNLPKDITAGIVVGIMLIPQGMAYAMIAGLPPVFGLYAALLPQVIYAILGTSRQLAVGPVAMDSLLVASGLSLLSLTGVEDYIAMALLLAFLMGAIQLLLGLFRMGFIVNYLSKPVISGFTSAAAIIIGLSQLKHLLGVKMENSNQMHHMVLNTLKHVSEINWPTFVLGLAGIGIIIAIKKFAKRIPGALIVVLFGVLAVYFFQLVDAGVSIVEEVPKGLPQFTELQFSTSNVSDLLPIAATLALIAFMEAISVAKAIEEKHDDYKVDANQELIALGTANVVGSFFQSYSVTGGFSRTAVNDQAGAKTGVAALVSALVVGLTLLFLTPLFYYLPHAVLASIIMVAVFGLIDFTYPKQLFQQDKIEYFLLLTTFLATLFIGIKEGILIGVFLSLIVTVYKISQPHVAILGQIKGTNYYRNINRFDEQVIQRESILIIRFDAPLFFGNKDFFREMVFDELQKRPKAEAVILNAESINYIDSSASHMLSQLITEINDKQVQFYIADAIGPVRDALNKNGLLQKIGDDHLFVQVNDVVNFIEGKSIPTDLQDAIAHQTSIKKT